MHARWPSIGAAALLLVGLTLPGLARADGDPEAALKELNTWYSGQLQQSRDSGARIDFTALTKERTEKARAAVANTKVGETDAAKCLALAQLYQAAQMPKLMAEAATRFLTSNPDAAKGYQARQMLIQAAQQARDAGGLAQLLKETTAPEPRLAMSLASMTARSYSDVIAAKLGAKAAIEIIDLVAGRVKADDAKTDQEKQAYEGMIVAVAQGKADLLVQEKRTPEAIQLLTDAKAKLPAQSRALRSLNSQITLLTIVGQPAPELVRERGYGEFAGLAKEQGKVVVIDFGAHW